MNTRFLLVLLLSLLPSAAYSREIAATRESMAENYRVPEWFRDGNINLKVSSSAYLKNFRTSL